MNTKLVIAALILISTSAAMAQPATARLGGLRPGPERAGGRGPTPTRDPLARGM